jgi:hypothetical protein
MTNIECPSPLIGLFGTCGGSQWRTPFKATYANRSIPFFDPQVDNWTPECATQEAWHLANDSLVLFPVTAETYGFGSLAETGFSLRQALSAHAHRFVIAYIDPDVSAELTLSDPAQAKASVRTRQLVRAHLQQANVANLVIAHSLTDMLDKSLAVWDIQQRLRALRAAPHVAR